MKKVVFLILVLSVSILGCSPLPKTTKSDYDLKMKNDTVFKSKMIIGTSLNQFTLYY